MTSWCGAQKKEVFFTLYQLPTSAEVKQLSSSNRQLTVSQVEGI
jgi:hypothetical protein